VPPVLLRESLAAQRLLGVPFRTAWGRALRHALHDASEPRIWGDVLRSTMAAWQDAYTRQGGGALGVAFCDRTVGTGAKLCKRPTCPKALPEGTRGYCSAECAREGEQEARSAVAA